MPIWFYYLCPATFLSMITIGLQLTPNPAGLGTHRALGLPACFFLTLTGIPCPSCGLTTSVTYLVHGQWKAAFHSHPLGPLFFIMFAWLSILCLLRLMGFDLFRLLKPKASWLPLTYAVLTVFFGTWIFRLISSI